MCNFVSIRDRRMCWLHAPIRGVVQPNRAGDDRYCPDVPVLRVHEHYCIHLFSSDGHNRLHVLLLVQLPNIRIDQS